METRFIIWSSVVAMLLVVFAVKAFSDFRKGKKHHFIEIGSDAEMFYCPGDPKPSDQE